MNLKKGEILEKACLQRMCSRNVEGQSILLGKEKDTLKL